MGIPRKQKPSPAEGEFLFQLDPEPLEECVTAYAGVPLFLQAARSLDVPGRVKQHLQLKQRQRGLDEAGYVESFLVLNAVGGECLDDFDRLREDEGLMEILGHEVPSPEAARKFLYQFHDESKRAQAQQELPAGQVSYIAEESTPLRALAQVNQEMVQEVGRRCAEQKIATVDLDSTIIESYKREALPTYQGGSGYQPMLALWAEMNLVLADEFRDGNVPAQKEPLRVARRAFQALPPTVGEYYFRGDSACWEKQLLSWLRDEQRADGPKGPITFGISVRMTPNLKKHIVRLEENLWKPYREDAGMLSGCADLLNYWPEDEERPEGAGPLRYIAIRMRKRQGELFADGSEAKYFVVLTTWGRGEILDLAVPTSGPPIARLDLACVAKASPEWAAQCAAIVPKGVMECATQQCILGPANDVCKQVSASPTEAQLLADSVVHPDAVLEYPKTKVHFLFGAADCGEPVPIGLMYATKVTSEKEIEFVPKTPHPIASTVEGREAVRKAIDEGTK